jgi:transcriptional regulator with XRE-family HTH domain
MQYTLRELFENLKITLTELSKRSGISDVTLISIRNGKSARRSTINTLLGTFSEIYGVKLTLKNVDGIIIQGKPVRPRGVVTEQVPIQPASKMTIDGSNQIEEPQNRIVERPDNLIPCKVFFEKQSHFSEKFSESSWMRWIKSGIKTRGHEAEEFEVTELPPSGNDGKYFFTPEQALKAVEILKRHGKLKTPDTEQEAAADDRPWYAPE